MMDPRQLACFLKVCEEKSVSRAAEKLYISQQGLSRIIRALEEELEAPLFLRDRLGMEPTIFGRALEQAGRSWLEQHEALVKEIRGLREERRRALFLGMSAGMGDFLPAGFFSDFMLQRPEIDLVLRTFSDEACLPAILEQELQVGMVPAPVDFRDFDSVYREKRRLFLVAGRGHPLARFDSIKLKDLRGHRVIDLNSRTYPQSLLLDLCRHAGVEPQVLLNGAENNLMAELCGTNRMVSFFAGPLERLPQLKRIELEDVDLDWEFHLVVNRHCWLSEGAQAFLRYAHRRLEGGAGA